MAKLVQGFMKDLPPYTDLIKFEEETKETPKQIKERLINKINSYNGGVE